jgi:hypothetical protein
MPPKRSRAHAVPGPPFTFGLPDKTMPDAAMPCLLSQHKTSRPGCSARGAALATALAGPGCCAQRHRAADLPQSTFCVGAMLLLQFWQHSLSAAPRWACQGLSAIKPLRCVHAQCGVCSTACRPAHHAACCASVACGLSLMLMCRCAAGTPSNPRLEPEEC